MRKDAMVPVVRYDMAANQSTKSENRDMTRVFWSERHADFQGRVIDERGVKKNGDRNSAPSAAHTKPVWGFMSRRHRPRVALALGRRLGVNKIRVLSSARVRK